MAKTYGLGKGLSSLIPPKSQSNTIKSDSPILPDQERIVQVPLEKVRANPLQPRHNFEHEAMEDLTNSIREHGILQPLIVVKDEKGYEIVAGERRFRASQILGLKTVPVIVRDIKEQQKLELALVENIQRKDLNPIEEAIAYRRLIDEFNLTQEEAAKKVGKSRTVVTNTLRLLSLPTEIQKAVISEKLPYSAARVIVGLPPEERMKFFQKVMKEELPVHAIEERARKSSSKAKAKKPIDPNLVSLEEKIQAILGTKVTIKKSGQTGSIIIDFYSPEELNELISKFNKL